MIAAAAAAVGAAVAVAAHAVELGDECGHRSLGLDRFDDWVVSVVDLMTIQVVVSAHYQILVVGVRVLEGHSRVLDLVLVFVHPVEN